MIDPSDATALFYLAEALSDAPDGEQTDILERFKKHSTFLEKTVGAIRRAATVLSLDDIDRNGLLSIALHLTASVPTEHYTVGRALLTSLERHGAAPPQAKAPTPEHKIMKPVEINDLNIHEGDVVKVPMVRRGDRMCLLGGKYNVPGFTIPVAGDAKSTADMYGIFVDESDITRAPMPRERVTMEYEVLRGDEKTQPGDVIEYASGRAPHIVTASGVTFTVRDACYDVVARVLRPVKKS